MQRRRKKRKKRWKEEKEEIWKSGKRETRIYLWKSRNPARSGKKKTKSCKEIETQEEESEEKRG